MTFLEKPPFLLFLSIINHFQSLYRQFSPVTFFFFVISLPLCSPLTFHSETIAFPPLTLLWLSVDQWDYCLRMAEWRPENKSGGKIKRQEVCNLGDGKRGRFLPSEGGREAAALSRRSKEVRNKTITDKNRWCYHLIPFFPSFIPEHLSILHQIPSLITLFLTFRLILSPLSLSLFYFDKKSWLSHSTRHDSKFLSLNGGREGEKEEEEEWAPNQERKRVKSTQNNKRNKNINCTSTSGNILCGIRWGHQTLIRVRKREGEREFGTNSPQKHRGLQLLMERCPSMIETWIPVSIPPSYPLFLEKSPTHRTEVYLALMDLSIEVQDSQVNFTLPYRNNSNNCWGNQTTNLSKQWPLANTQHLTDA